MNRKMIILLLTITVLLGSVSVVLAQTEEMPVPTEEVDFTLTEIDEEDLLDDIGSYFSRVYVRSDYSDNYPYSSYRFPTEYDNYYDFYDPLEMINFPHETLGEGDRSKNQITRWSVRTIGTDRTDWGLYEMGRNQHFLHQMIYLPSPAATSVYYGRPAGREDGSRSDFYLYADLYLTDVYPEDGGSCFVTYSNSLNTGFNSNKKMVLNVGRNLEYRKNEDLQVPIPERTAADGYYRYYGNESDIAKSTVVVGEFADNACSDTNCYAVGNDIFPDLHLDERMQMDFEREKAAREAKGLSFEPKIYRVEIIRRDGMTTFYVNGDKLISVEDGIEEAVSWGAGPVIFPSGRSATCDIGTFVIMEK